jgi:hypothetical protein
MKPFKRTCRQLANHVYGSCFQKNIRMKTLKGFIFGKAKMNLANFSKFLT